MFKLELSRAELDLIGNALGQMPFAAVHGLVSKINDQIQMQQMVAEARAVGSDLVPPTGAARLPDDKQQAA